VEAGWVRRVWARVGERGGGRAAGTASQNPYTPHLESCNSFKKFSFSFPGAIKCPHSNRSRPLVTRWASRPGPPAASSTSAARWRGGTVASDQAGPRPQGILLLSPPPRGRWYPQTIFSAAFGGICQLVFFFGICQRGFGVRCKHGPPQITEQGARLSGLIFGPEAVASASWYSGLYIRNKSEETVGQERRETGFLLFARFFEPRGRPPPSPPLPWGGRSLPPGAQQGVHRHPHVQREVIVRLRAGQEGRDQDFS